ncbi:MAG: hypothetical protein QMD71_06985 [bacterium]|nr:hypothetical protein [bacterium]
MRESQKDIGSYLTKVEIEKRKDIHKLYNLGLPIYEDMHSYIIADATPNFIRLLIKEKFKFQVLDTNP